MDQGRREGNPIALHILSPKHPSLLRKEAGPSLAEIAQSLAWG